MSVFEIGIDFHAWTKTVKKDLRREWKLDHYFLVVSVQTFSDALRVFCNSVYNSVSSRRPRASSLFWFWSTHLHKISKNRDHSADSWTGFQVFPTYVIVSGFHFFVEKLVKYSVRLFTTCCCARCFVTDFNALFDCEYFKLLVNQKLLPFKINSLLNSRISRLVFYETTVP